MLSGLPGSGKSTRAREMIKEYGNTVRLNRDDLRGMLHDGRWTGRNENITVDIEIMVAKRCLMKGTNVIIDDTNLNPKNKLMWAGVANEMKAGFEHVHIDTSIEECVERDSERKYGCGGYVGKSVIMKMAMQYGLWMPGTYIVVSDLDGTIANCEHRLKYAKGPEKNWDKFFQGIPQDTPRKEVVSQVLGRSQTVFHPLILVSARPEKYRYLTEEWLAKYDIPFDCLIMRGDGDKRDDTIVKQEIYDKYLKRYPIDVVFDDRPKVVRMWRANNVNVIDVGPGIEF